MHSFKPHNNSNSRHRPVVPPGVSWGHLVALSSGLIQDTVVRMHWVTDILSIILETCTHGIRKRMTVVFSRCESVYYMINMRTEKERFYQKGEVEGRERMVRDLGIGTGSLECDEGSIRQVLTFLGCSAHKVSVGEIEWLLKLELLCEHFFHLVAGIDIEPAEAAVKLTSNTSLKPKPINTHGKVIRSSPKSRQVTILI